VLEQLQDPMLPVPDDIGARPLLEEITILTAPIPVPPTVLQAGIGLAILGLSRRRGDATPAR
jgi:hypothetical protein